MIKSEKEYLEKQVRAIVNAKLLKCECDKPKLETHVLKALAQNSAKLKSSNEIIELCEKQMIENKSSYGKTSVNISAIIKEPQSYLDEKKEYEKEQDKIKNDNDKMLLEC